MIFILPVLLLLVLFPTYRVRGSPLDVPLIPRTPYTLSPVPSLSDTLAFPPTVDIILNDPAPGILRLDLNSDEGLFGVPELAFELVRHCDLSYRCPVYDVAGMSLRFSNDVGDGDISALFSPTTVVVNRTEIRSSPSISAEVSSVDILDSSNEDNAFFVRKWSWWNGTGGRIRLALREVDDLALDSDGRYAGTILMTISMTIGVIVPLRFELLSDGGQQIDIVERDVLIELGSVVFRVGHQFAFLYSSSCRESYESIWQSTAREDFMLGTRIRLCKELWCGYAHDMASVLVQGSSSEKSEMREAWFGIAGGGAAATADVVSVTRVQRDPVYVVVQLRRDLLTLSAPQIGLGMNLWLSDPNEENLNEVVSIQQAALLTRLEQDVIEAQYNSGSLESVEFEVHLFEVSNLWEDYDFEELEFVVTLNADAVDDTSSKNELRFSKTVGRHSGISVLAHVRVFGIVNLIVCAVLICCCCSACSCILFGFFVRTQITLMKERRLQRMRDEWDRRRQLELARVPEGFHVLHPF